MKGIDYSYYYEENDQWKIAKKGGSTQRKKEKRNDKIEKNEPLINRTSCGRHDPAWSPGCTTSPGSNLIFLCIYQWVCGLYRIGRVCHYQLNVGVYFLILRLQWKVIAFMDVGLQRFSGYLPNIGQCNSIPVFTQVTTGEKLEVWLKCFIQQIIGCTDSG